MSKAWAGGSTRRWREIRAAVLLRDRGRCVLRLPGQWRTGDGALRWCTGTATQAHHKHGKNRCTGCAIDALDHLQAACRACNLRVGDPGRCRPTFLRDIDAEGAVTRW